MDVYNLALALTQTVTICVLGQLSFFNNVMYNVHIHVRAMLLAETGVVLELNIYTCMYIWELHTHSRTLLTQHIYVVTLSEVGYLQMGEFIYTI